jgi:hypothetical protein
MVEEKISERDKYCYHLQVMLNELDKNLNTQANFSFNETERPILQALLEAELHTMGEINTNKNTGLIHTLRSRVS